MMKFMVIGPPRSGTAWASVWLDAYHDPLWDFYLDDLDRWIHHGVACTGLGSFPDYVSRHPARKIILHRDPDDVNRSLGRMGLPDVHPALFHSLDSLEGLHVPWTELFTHGSKLWYHLFPDTNFDHLRHKQLKMLKITTDWRAREAAQSPAVKRQWAAHGIVGKSPTPV